MSTKESDNLLTVGEVARILRVEEITVRRWIDNGSLKAVLLPGSLFYRTYRIKRSTLDAILAGDAS